ncbi:MAG: protein kinase [Deltaproteobacteria bacterium]|nr:protein kinase [Deltaproteobacteria bacterium]
MERELSGAVVGEKYRLKELLGQGGMGLVYAAEHTLLGRPLAVKLLKREFARDRIAVQRFQQEAVNASKAGSPNIVAIHDLGETEDGIPFIVMEYLEGVTLYAAMGEDPKTGANGVFDVPQAADVLCQVLAGLCSAHEHGIVHRDLKPGNIFLTTVGGRTNFVKLLDFGVSKVLGGDRVMHMTRTGVLLGTPTYMAPEQVMGRKDVDHRVDLWAAGVILFRLLTGRRPHAGSVTAERLASIVSEDAPPLRSLRPDLDAGLEGLLRKALAREPGARFQAAYDFAEALAPYRDLDPAPLASTFTLAPAPPVSGTSAPPAASPSSRPVTLSGAPHGAGAPTVAGIPTPSCVPAAGGPHILLKSGTFEQPTTAMPAPVLPQRVLPVASMGTPTPGAVPRPAAGPTHPHLPARRSHGSVTTWVSALSLVVIGVSVAVILVLHHRGSDDAAPGTATPPGVPAAAVGTESPLSPAAAVGLPALPSAEPAAAADRERYIAVMTAVGCRQAADANEADPDPAKPPGELLERLGIEPGAWPAMAARHAGDPEAARAIAEALRHCNIPSPD